MRKAIVSCRTCFFALTVICFLNLTLHAQPTVIYSPLITAGLNSPMEVLSAPGDASERLFIVEKGGTVKIWNGTSLLATPFINIGSLVRNSGEQGLLSMAFHPQYASNGYFFLYYNSFSSTNVNGNITISRFKVSGSDANVAEPTPDPADPLVSISKSFGNHNGGHLQFKVEGATNYLYFGTGDGGGTNDPDNNAQNEESLLGKMLRFDVDIDPEAELPITPEIWGMGLRNPFRWSFDRANGDMWIGDVGQGRVEEVNYLAGGTEDANFGWRCFEGTEPTPGVDPCNPSDPISPILEYDNPTEGRSVVGGYVYRGSIAELQGYYLATDFFTQTLWLIQKDGSNFNITTRDNLAQYVTSISEVENGDLYVTKSPGLAGEPGEDTVFLVTTNTIVPLKLTHFSVVPGTGFNDLKWTTAMEQNIARFVIEYSTNATDYMQAANVEATNNPSGATYTYRHSYNIPQKTFYRLRIEEVNGHIEYSAVVAVGGSSANEIKIYPTIVNNSTIHVNSTQHIDAIRVYNLQGKEMFSKNLSGINGYFTVALPQVQKGMYIIRLTMNGMIKNQRIIVQ